jgi:hypothetical protein
VSGAPAPTPSPAPAPTPTTPPAAGVSLEQVDGGPDYYSRFTGSLPTSPDFWPTAVWGAYNSTQANRDLDAAAGINTYAWLADPCGTGTAIQTDGRFHVLYEESENRSCSGAATKGWMIGDEVDMCCGPPGFAGGNGFQILTDRHNSLPADGKMRYTNYGKGVLWWESDQDAARFVNLPFLGLVSADAYWMTDPNERGNPKYRLPSSYGWNVDRLRQLDAIDGQRKPVWMLVETGWPFTESAAQGGRAITPAELRAAAWHSIIAGARGIVWFAHSFGGPHAGDHHTIRTNSEGTRQAVTDVDAQIRNLGPVLNAPTVTSGVDTSAPVRAMVKWKGGHFYVFAGSRNNQSSTGTVSIPCVGSATAVRLGEAGSVPVSGGSFSDQFVDGNAIHMYRIDGGSTCGLPTETPQPPPAVGGPPESGEPPKRRGSRVGRLPRRMSLRSRRLAVPVTCAARCTVRSRLTMRGAARRIVLAAKQRQLGPGRHKLVLRLSKRDRRRLARAHRPPSLRVHTVIVEPRGAGARRTQRLVIRRR